MSSQPSEPCVDPNITAAFVNRSQKEGGGGEGQGKKTRREGRRENVGGEVDKKD